MRVQVRLFAVLRDRSGTDRVEVELPEGATVAEALTRLAGLPGLAGVDRGGARMAVNREYAPDLTPLRAGDELALIPPVSGGAGPDQAIPRPLVHARISAEPLSLDALNRRVADPAAGAIVSFQGLPRDIASLDYEAYAEMAEPRMAAILAEALERHGCCAIAAEHRVGAVPSGEPSIIVAASSPHRAEAFLAAREALDRIKAEAPIWKVEVGADGSRTPVEGTLPPG